MADHTDREAILREIAKKKVVYTMPGMDDLPVRRDLKYHGDLPMDVYCPALSTGPAPIVIMPFAFADPEGRIRAYGPATSWAQLIAASGMTAAIYGASTPAEDAVAAIRYVRANADALNVDATRMGLFAESANATLALSLLMRDTALRCAALLCGYTLDLDGSTTVADAATQFQFVNACAGRTPDDLPANVPMLFVRAGHDQFPGLNDAMDRVIARALARNLPITLVNHATGAHGFDMDDNSPLSRAIVRQTLAFLRLHLGA